MKHALASAVDHLHRPEKPHRGGQFGLSFARLDGLQAHPHRDRAHPEAGDRIDPAPTPRFDGEIDRIYPGSDGDKRLDDGRHALRICNNAAVAADGTIYFSDSTQRFDLEYYTADLIEHSGTGRLLRRTPDGEVDVLLDGLHFANGVALAPDQFDFSASTLAAPG